VPLAEKRRASATGCSRSAIRSASAAPSRPASCRRAGATSAPVPYDDFIQIDAPVNKGNSGGPTFDVDGNVIGVNTAIYSPSGGSVGIAFAIPSDTVKTVVTSSRTRAR
jgi:S1-C subfamily serine protease